MSFDLAFWSEDPPPSQARAADVYDRLADGESDVLPASPAVGRFLDDVDAAFPDLTEDTLDVSPWAAAVYRTSECAIVSISWSRVDDVVPVLLTLASRHRLTAYDPQTGQVRA